MYQTPKVFLKNLKVFHTKPRKGFLELLLMFFTVMKNLRFFFKEPYYTLHTRHDNVIFGNYFGLKLLGSMTGPRHKSLGETAFMQGLNIPKYGKTGIFPQADIFGTRDVTGRVGFNHRPIEGWSHYVGQI
jgi:hypothetical protein